MSAEISQEHKQQIVDVVAQFLKQQDRDYFYTSSFILRRLRHPAVQGVSESMLDRILLEHERTQAPLIIQSRKPLGQGLNHYWTFANVWNSAWPTDQERIRKAISGYRPDPYAATRHSFFISYSSTDLDVALSFRNALNMRGYGGFIAHVENNNNADAIEFVRTHLPAHDYYVTCLSISAVKSEWVRQEWRVVRDQHKKPCLIVFNGRDEVLLEVVANVDDSHYTVPSNRTSYLIFCRWSKVKRIENGLKLH